MRLLKDPDFHPLGQGFLENKQEERASNLSGGIRSQKQFTQVAVPFPAALRARCLPASSSAKWREGSAVCFPYCASNSWLNIFKDLGDGKL